MRDLNDLEKTTRADYSLTGKKKTVKTLTPYFLQGGKWRKLETITRTDYDAADIVARRTRGTK